jgi:hypothetical protein
MRSLNLNEEGLRDWFGKSKSKDGKPGWVNVVTGGTCASDKPGEGVPKCVSSTKRASMTPEERKSAARRKKEKDPGQQQKTGAAKPTYVSTDTKKKMKEEVDTRRAPKELVARLSARREGEMAQDGPNKAAYDAKQRLLAKAKAKMKKEELELDEAKDKKGKGSGKKDACYSKVKSRYSVWPSAYASGALVKCRKVGAKNWGNKSESVEANAKMLAGERYCDLCQKMEKRDECMYGPKMWDKYSREISEDCWVGYKQVGMKKKGKKKVPNCVPEQKTFDQFISESAAWTKKAGKSESGGLNEKGRKSYEAENPGSDLKAPSKKKGNKRRASFCARMKGMKKKLTSAKTARDPDSRINKSLRAWDCN